MRVRFVDHPRVLFGAVQPAHPTSVSVGRNVNVDRRTVTCVAA